jgi:hypothetical protein
MAKNLLVGKDIGSYTFDASEKKVYLNNIPDLSLNEILMITNVTDGIIIYLSQDSNTISSAFSLVSGDDYVITLNYDTTSMSDTDTLQIWLHYKDEPDVQTKDSNENIPTKENRLLVDSAIGRENISTALIWVKTAGSSGDTVTISINGISNLVTTLTATEASDEVALAELIVSDFNGSSNHNDKWISCIHKISSDYVIIHIEAINTNNNESIKSTHGDFSISTTGTTEVIAENDNIVKRNGHPELIRKCSEPYIKTISVNNDYKQPIKSGIFQSYLNYGGSIEMAVDGSSSSVTFGYFANSTKDTWITELRLHAEGSSSKMLDFIDVSNGLYNGLELKWKSANTTVTFMDIQTTWDLLNKFAYPSEEFYIIREQGTDYVTAVRRFKYPILLKKAGTFTYDDYVTIKVRDDLSGMTKLRCSLFGFYENITV